VKKTLLVGVAVMMNLIKVIYVMNVLRVQNEIGGFLRRKRRGKKKNDKV